MKLTVFQAGKGDSILISIGKHLILADGGTGDAYRQFVAPSLAKLAKQDRRLDLVYVSHSDDDHIGGIVQLLRDLVEWRIHDYQKGHGNPGHEKPEWERPPEIKEVWNNGFSEMVGENSGPLVEALGTCARNLLLLRTGNALQESMEFSNLAASVTQAIELTRRIGPDFLDIRLNVPFNGDLMYVTDPPTMVSYGKLQVRIIGPFKEDLKVYRDFWNKWLKDPKNKPGIVSMREKTDRDKKRLYGEMAQSPLKMLMTSAKVLGNRKSVTPPNLASTMLLLKEGKKTVIMAGDGHSDDILGGLGACGMLSASGGCHVDVLKVPHHGSEHNATAEFPKQVTAEHYVFCGNGFRGNPELAVLRAFLDSRMGPTGKRSANPETGRPFTFWFNTSPKATKPQYKKHIEKVQKLIKDAQAKSGGQFKGYFLDKPSFDLDL